MTKRVLISGASVAGPTVAYGLARHGWDVTVVERAAGIRAGGYSVDFRGDAFGVLEDMGILGELRSHDTRMCGTDIVDADGTVIQELPAEEFAGEMEVPKADLTRILHRVTADDVRYIFGDSIRALTQDAGGVHVEFEHAASADYDVVVGADGVYSTVRRLAFGPHDDYLHHLGMSGVGFTIGNYLGLNHRVLLQPAPGRAVLLFSANDRERMTVSLSFATDTARDDRLDRAQQEALTRQAFADAGWEVPRLLDEMTNAADLLFASTCQIEMDGWSTGRIVLVGDAAACAAPTSGMGTSQALIGAHFLAAQLGRAATHTTAFEAYERELRPYVEANQEKGRQAAQMLGA